MRVLIVKTSSMGDVVHALPMVSDIARAYPRARIDWVVEESFAAIPRMHPSVTRVFAVALRRWRRRPLARDSWRELLEARAAMRRTRYHTIIDCQGLIKSALIACTARGPVTGFASDSAREPLAALLYARTVNVPRDLHAVDRCRQLGAGALAYALDGPERFCLHDRVAGFEAEPPFDARGGVLLLTNASRPGKLWPDIHWAALEGELAAAGYCSVLPWGSAGEQQDCERRVARMQAASVLPRAGLAQIATLAARSALVVGLDTGLTHLAAAVGTPTVGIYCDYDPARVGLRGSAHVASLGGVDQVPAVREVLAAVEKVLGRPPYARRPA